MHEICLAITTKLNSNLTYLKFIPKRVMDLIFFQSRCDFSKAHCDDTSIHLASHSACPTTTTPPPTTAPPGGVVTNHPLPSTLAPILHGSEAVLDFFCFNLAFKPCDGGSNPVCGNDTITYQNP